MKSPKHIHPSITLRAFSCPHCGAMASQAWFRAYARSTEKGEPPHITTRANVENIRADMQAEHRPGVKEGLAELIKWGERAATGEFFLDDIGRNDWATETVTNLSFSVCYACSRLALWRHDALIYPATRYEIEPNADLPEEIRADFNEARAVFDTSPRAAAALLRLCIQKLCIHLGEKGKKIDEDIGALVKRGLPTPVQQALDLVRVVGNNAVHPGTLDLNDDRQTAAKLFVLVNMVSEKLITEPNAVAALFDEKVPQGAKDAIARRDAIKP